MFSFIFKSFFSGTRNLYRNLFASQFKTKIIDKLVKPLWTSFLWGTTVVTTYSYAKWEEAINAINPGTLEGASIQISKTQAFLIWIYNLKFVNFLYSIINNIALFFKLPIIVVTIFFIIFFFLIFFWLLRKLFVLIFSRHKVSLFTTNDPQTIVQKLVSDNNTALIEKDMQIANLQAQLNQLSLSYNTLMTKVSTLTSALNNKVTSESISTNNASLQLLETYFINLKKSPFSGLLLAPHNKYTNVEINTVFNKLVQQGILNQSDSHFISFLKDNIKP